MIRNFENHKQEELDEKKHWSMWQTEMLKSLEKYKHDNQKKYGKQFKDINKQIEVLIRLARSEGGMNQEKRILEEIKKGFPAKRISKGGTAEFFKVNDRKLDALIQATTSDMQKAEAAVLRMANDQYRKIIYNAQVYANTGAGTYEKAVDMATKDFLSAGLNCIQYINGARHTIADYADMAIRTASKRAYLQGEGEMRQQWGMHLVIMNKRGSPCPKCLPFVGKILIDDVWSGGSRKDGKYPLMSSAVAAGLYHPRCKDSHMSATSVGQIGLDLVVNKNQFESQMAGITGMAKKAGAALAAAFGVKKLVDFGKQCLELGSDLAEVQNVVDVTFPKMTAQVDEFAKNAAQSFGLSETMAKQYTGTFGAMAKAFGFTEKQAYDMGSTLTGLAGDVASFYNISQDEAYTKLKSVFTGETESLKDLGVVMTQTALDSYAMANGFGKTTSAMSEAEKVALRYQFVQDKLSAAQGDFARTSGSWANQCRVLSLQMQSLMATIGQGLINLFTPIIRVINTVIGKLATLANAFKSFTELITGNKSGGSDSSGVAAVAGAADDAGTGLENASDSASNLASNTDKVGQAAQNAAKKMKALMGFDKVNKLDSQSDSSSGSSSSPSNKMGGTGALGSAVDFGNLAEGDTVLDKTDKKMSALIKRCQELAKLFKKGYEIGFGNSQKKIDSINESVKSIGKNLKEVFTDTAVVNAANRCANNIAFAFGKITGSTARITFSFSL